MTGVVVVGLGRRTSEVALRWAADQAASSKARLVVVRAWRPSAPQAGSRGTPSAVTADRRAARKDADKRLHRDVEQVLGKAHGAEVDLVFGGKRRALVEASKEADLLVIEAPRAITSDTGPGFVSRLVMTAHCPVVVVPRTTGERRARVRRTAVALGKGVAGAAGRAPRPGLGHLQPPKR